jgi:hypothetical protein
VIKTVSHWSNKTVIEEWLSMALSFSFKTIFDVPVVPSINNKSNYPDDDLTR